MRILHYIPVYAPAWQFGGPVQSTSILCETLAALGHQVTVFTTDAGLGEKFTGAIGRCMVRNGVGVWYFKASYALGIHSRGLTEAIGRRCTEFDLIHVTGVWQPTSIAACRAAKRSGVPYVISPRGALSPYSRRQKLLKKLVYYLLFERRHAFGAAGIHYTSRMELEECVRLGLPGRTCVIPNAVSLSRWGRDEAAGAQWRREMDLTPDEFALINVGRLHHLKGLDLLPAALAPLAGLKWRMVFIGPPEDQTRNELQAAFRRLGLIDRVRFFDVLAPERLVGAYSGADLFLFPSRHEGFGNVVIEAMACGCPVVLSDQVGAGDHVKDLALATVLPRDVEHWTTHLEARMRRGRQRPSSDPAGSETLRARFDPLKMAEAMAAFYTEILAVRSPRPGVSVT